jgi:hypothetical protein
MRGFHCDKKMYSDHVDYDILSSRGRLPVSQRRLVSPEGGENRFLWNVVMAYEAEHCHDPEDRNLDIDNV